MDKWTLVRRFNRLAVAGLVAPICCPDCKREVVFLIGEGDDPIMYCTWDGGTFLPGLQFWSDMRAVVKEHYLE